MRGFHLKNPAAKELLESVGRNFLGGFAAAAEARAPEDAEPYLASVPRQFSGFAHEGAAMAFAMVDALPLGVGGGRVDRFLAGGGRQHVYMAYVGVGWAMARLPRSRWARLSAHDDLLRWLVLDGYGFHQAYFHTDRYVHRHYREPDFPWPASGPRWYANRAIDQGIGRALWFVGGTDVERVLELVDGFPETRRADLFAGIGLAATYAGGAGADELRLLVERSGPHRRLVAQGSAFGAEARVHAGLVVEHTRLATEVLCGATPEQAGEWTRRVRPTGPVPGDVPAYEVWRQSIADEFVTSGGVEQ